MIPDELLEKINSIADLPLSEELLGTYLEGNLKGSELREVQNLIGSDQMVSDFCDLIYDSHLNEIAYPSDISLPFISNSIGSFECSFDSCEVPIVSEEQSYGLIEADPHFMDNYLLGHIDSPLDNQNDSLSDNEDTLPSGEEINLYQ